MTGISEIAKGDMEIEQPQNGSEAVGVLFSDLHPDDQELMFWYEQDEPAMTAIFIHSTAKPQPASR